jgi:hypothetical protein
MALPLWQRASAFSLNRNANVQEPEASLKPEIEIYLAKFYRRPQGEGWRFSIVQKWTGKIETLTPQATA